MIAISLGDVTGIGPEVTLKALALDSFRSNFLIIGDEGRLTRLNHQLGIGLTWRPYSPAASEEPGIYLYNPLSAPLPEHLPPGSPVAAKAAVAWLKAGAELCLAGKAKALVTAPVNKESIIRSGENSFVGQTEFLSNLARAQRTAMMLLGADDRNRWIRVVLATTHLPLRLVADQLTTAKVELAIELAAQSCRDLRLPRQRVGVCGLNPHAGEGGKLGTEEKTVIDPAVASAKKKGLDVVGPLAGRFPVLLRFQGRVRCRRRHVPRPGPRPAQNDRL